MEQRQPSFAEALLEGCRRRLDGKRLQRSCCLSLEAINSSGKLTLDYLVNLFH